MAMATRDAYGKIIAKLVKENEKIVVLDADLAGSTKAGEAGKVAPERFFDMGIAEANMIGHAAGLASSGYVAFASSFAMFATGRCWEQIRNSVAYPHLNVKVVGSHAGITVGEDGVSHQACEDISIIRSIPGMEVYCPADPAETIATIKYVAGTQDPCYVRCGRAVVADVYSEDQEFDVTKANVIRKGEKIAVFATGVMVDSAMKAAEMFAKEGIELTVVDICRIKPIDVEGVTEVLKNHEVIFTAEEHSTVGGLGSAVCEVACDTCPRIIHRIGLQDKFAESGPAAELMKKYELDAAGVYKQISAIIK